VRLLAMSELASLSFGVTKDVAAMIENMKAESTQRTR
jgi:hypothetical protein